MPKISISQRVESYPGSEWDGEVDIVTQSSGYDDHVDVVRAHVETVEAWKQVLADKADIEREEFAGHDIKTSMVLTKDGYRVSGEAS